MIITKEKNLKYLSKLLTTAQETHSYKEARKPIVRTKFTKEDKIKFALDYYDKFDQSLLITLEEVNNKALKRQIIEFMARYGLLKLYPSSEYEHIRKISELELIDQRIRSLNIANIKREYNHQNWLEPFDENAMFEETKAKHPYYQYYLDVFDKPVKFDKQKATSVKLAIIDQGIIPSRCIVESAYPYVAKNTFPKYIEYIKTLKGGK